MGSGHERVEGGSGGVMRRLAAGAKSGGFANAFQLVDALFSPSKTASYVEREESRRRRVAVPAPGDPPADAEVDGWGAPDDAAALPRYLLGPVEVDGPSARGEQPSDALE